MSRRPPERDEHGEARRRLRRLRRLLLAWYARERRDLPWRRTRDPYAIWISETMLQQTRVETVIPYYERFLRHFPDARSLAAADLEQLYSLWTGLGYYSRARHLQQAAKTLVREYTGQLPERVEELRALSGIGRYTAGAVASIAFDRPEPVVDGNVSRVLARVLAIREDVRSKPVVERLWAVASDLVKGARPGDLNQALMELGATLCTPRSPACERCPVRTCCAALRSGEAETLPIKSKGKPAQRIEAVAGWLVRRGRALAVQRPREGLLGGLWELPGGEMLAGEDATTALARQLEARLGLTLRDATPVGEVRHVFTHRRLRLYVFRCHEPRGRIRRQHFADHRWLAPSALGALPHGGPTRKALALLGEGDAEPHRARLRRPAGVAAR